MQIPRHSSEKFKVRDTGPVHLTPDGLKRLQERLAGLKKALPDLISEAARTAAYGDRSDNAEYKEAKHQLRRTHRQIFSLEDQLKRAVVIKSGKNAAGTIQIGSVVVLERLSLQKTYEVVGPQETNPTKGRISFQSPLGAALMNHKKGDAVEIKTASGLQEYRILEVS